jgi:hypothetical protein
VLTCYFPVRSFRLVPMLSGITPSGTVTRNHDAPVQIAERSTRVVIRAHRSQFIYTNGLITLFFKRGSSKSTLLYYNLLTFGAVC